VVALGPAGPAGAESTTDCHARLNAVRARAGLPRASAGTLPALARAAASHAAYRVRVDPGDHALVRRLRDRGPFGPDATAHQQTPSLRALGYSGVNPWDRTRAAGLKDGSWRYQYEDVVTATGVTAGDLRGVRSWVDAPYHRFPLLDVNTATSAARSAPGRQASRPPGPAPVGGSPNPGSAQRTPRKNSRTSATRRSGASIAAKWPPRSNSDQCTMLLLRSP
jgi:hypothetical protein